MQKKIMVFIVLLAVLSAIPAVLADTGRFSGMTYKYRVETQEEVDALPKVIDATGYDIGILVEGSSLVLEGFTIIGSNGFGDVCIAVDGQSDVTVTNCETKGGFLGIYYYMSSGKITHNYVHDYIKNGITSNEESVDGESVEIKWNTVVGRGPLAAGDWAQNGIQVGYGSAAKVMFNEVSDNYYIPDNWAASGILIFESSYCTIHGNTLDSNDIGIAVETWGWFETDASNNKIVKNTIRKSDYAISVSSIAWKYTSVGNPVCYNNKVVNNNIEDSVFGISYGAYAASDAFDPTTDNTKLIHNKFKNVETEFDDWGGDTSTKVHANVAY